VTFFEYITVAVSLVLALAVARTVDGLRSSFAAEKRYWVHATWVVIKLTNPMTFWWTIWRFRDVETWNLAAFILIMSWPVVLYLQVTSLVTRQPELVTDWRSHFYEQRTWFFGANVLLNIIGLPLAPLLGAQQSFSMARLVIVALSIVGLATSKQRVHAIIVIGIAITVILGYWLPSYTPAA